MQSADEPRDPADCGADAAVQLLPDGIAEQVAQSPPRDADPGNAVFSYAEVARHYAGAPAPAWRTVECVLPGWDDSPRRGDGQSTLLHGATPELYEEWLTAARRRADAGGVVLINAWNDWADGAYLEPDLRHGDGFLQATARAVGAPMHARAAGDVLGPLAAVSFGLRDRFAELYLDTVENLTIVQRRLSRLEGTFERQLDQARAAAEAEAARLRTDAAALLLDNERMRAQLHRLRMQDPDPDTDSSPAPAQLGTG